MYSEQQLHVFLHWDWQELLSIPAEKAITLKNIMIHTVPEILPPRFSLSLFSFRPFIAALHISVTRKNPHRGADTVCTTAKLIPVSCQFI